MKYRIGTLSDLLGISSETIRLYEREGIIHTRRDENSGYRFFKHLDLTALFRARTYHNYGFSIKEMEKLINSKDLQEVIGMYDQREEDLEKEIQLKQYTLEYLRKMGKLVATSNDQKNTCHVITSPHFYRLEFMEYGELFLPKEDYPLFAKWSEYTPFVAMSHRSVLSDLLHGKTHQITALTVEKRYADLFSLPFDHVMVKEFKPCQCIYTIVEEAGEQFDEIKCLKHVFTYAEESGIHISGDPITRTFVSYDLKNAYRRVREVWIPIEERRSIR